MKRIIALMLIVSLLSMLFPAAMAQGSTVTTGSPLLPQGIHIVPTTNPDGSPHREMLAGELPAKAACVYIPSGVTVLRSGSLISERTMQIIIIPETVTEIEDGALPDSTRLRIFAPQGSEALAYAQVKGYQYVSLKGSLADQNPRYLASVLLSQDPSYNPSSKGDFILNYGFTDVLRLVSSDARSIAVKAIWGWFRGKMEYLVQYEEKALADILTIMDKNTEGKSYMLSDEVQADLDLLNNAKSVAQKMDKLQASTFDWVAYIQQGGSLSDPVHQKFADIIDEYKIIDIAEWYQRVAEFLQYCGSDYYRSATILEILETVTSYQQDKTLHTAVVNLRAQYEKKLSGMIDKAWDVFGSYVTDKARDKALKALGSSTLILVDLILSGCELIGNLTGAKSELQNSLYYIACNEIAASASTALGKFVESTDLSTDAMNKYDLTLQLYYIAHMEKYRYGVLLAKDSSVRAEQQSQYSDFEARQDMVGIVAAMLGQTVPDETEEVVDGDHHHYQVFSFKGTWTEAVQYCESLGGHLATITSAEENALVDGIMKSSGYQDAYFGFTDQGHEGQWVWVTGEPTEYVNWHAGEPNNTHNGQQYAMYYHTFGDGTWNDGDLVTDRGAIICEWDSDEEYEAHLNSTAGSETQSPGETAGIIGPLKVGDHIQFGHYYYDIDGEMLPIEWRVLAVQDDAALIITAYGIDTMKYNAEEVDTTWAQSSVRGWLNNEFYSIAFSAGEQERIIETAVANDGNEGYKGWHTRGGADTLDKIFLLSYKEAWSYFSSDRDRITTITPYAAAHAAVQFPESINAKSGNKCWWWLRSPGDTQYRAATVSAYGSLTWAAVHYSPGSIRPAMWVKTGSLSDYEYAVLENGTAQITKYLGKDSELAIPSVINGHTVTSIGDKAFYSCSGLTSVTIPASVTTIGENAFSSCYKLTSVTISDGVTSIGDNAFSYCRRLTDVTIPGSVVSIGNSAFSFCKGLTNVTIADGVATIGYTAFFGCESLTSVTLPASVTSIGRHAFHYYKNHTRVPINTTITLERGSYAEQYCKSNGITYVCPAAQPVETPVPTEGSMDSGKQQSDDYLYNVYNDGTAHIIRYTGTESVLTIPSVLDGYTVSSIGNGTFQSCDRLTGVTIPDSVTSIGHKAFADCPGLTVTVISGSYAEQYCTDNNINFAYADSLDWLNN